MFYFIFFNVKKRLDFFGVEEIIFKNLKHKKVQLNVNT